MLQQYANTATQIPDDVARIAHEQQLGTPQTRHMISRLSRGWRVPQFIFPFVLLFFMIAFATLLIILSIPSVNTAMIIFTILIPSIVICYLALLACAIAIRLTNKTCNIYPCDKGLILKQSTTKFRVIRWEEIEAIWHTSARTLSRFYFRSQLYTIHCHDGYTLTFSGVRRALSNMDSFNKALEEQFTRRRLPFQFADYQAGQTLNFGPLSLNHTGIAVRDKMLPWEQIADMTLLKNRYLLIHKAGEKPEVWQKFPAFKIPNLRILLALFKRIRSGQSEQEAGFAALAAYGTAATIVQSRGRIDALPEGLAALAEEHKLGERRLDQHLGRSRLTSWAAIITLLSAEVILMATMTGYGIAFSSALDALIRSPLFVIFTEFTLFSLLLTPVTIIAIIHNFQHIHNYTYTFERGVILKRGQQTPVVCRWEDVETVWRIPGINWYARRQQHILPQRLWAYTIQLRDGVKYTLTRLNIKQESLGKIIKEQVVPLQLPAIADAFQAGQTLTFGRVRVSQQGITVDTHLLPWPQVKSVSLEGNRLVVYNITQRKPWQRLQAKHIPNLFLLFALADYARDFSR